MATPMVIVFDYDLFVLQVPMYANEQTYPESLIETYWDIATNYVSDLNVGWINGSTRQYAINLMAAHLIYLAGLIAIGQVPGLMQTATIDKVTVGLTPPPLKNQWQWWLSTTPYGQQLFALLQVQSVGGGYIGGSPVRSSFGFGNIYG